MLEAWGLTLTADIARQVREWRADGYSWRAIAACADDTWGTDSGGNQLFDEDLCRESARLLSEDLNADPWN
ncbi:hypothetical protein DKT68_19375 [Micromonospora acroterricola]|uniref:Uncharacterized protein n=1 Tax=Micromonospora acroterricola TaxID=2202421 RepID=A0A317CYB3_9ACTN|nr:hypothetical protein [Micromonospora acroterricola]PWR07242.1 hypothetical protein DKT68_19375 [Micromonospora acroterricola]